MYAGVASLNAGYACGMCACVRPCVLVGGWAGRCCVQVRALVREGRRGHSLLRQRVPPALSVMARLRRIEEQVSSHSYQPAVDRIGHIPA